MAYLRVGFMALVVAMVCAAILTVAAPSAAGQCVGDCNDDGSVTINELITGVNIAVGSVDIATCPAFDSNTSGTVEINELIAAVNAALCGCGPCPTPPPTRTPTPTRTPSFTSLPTHTVTPTPSVRVDGYWREDNARLAGSNCDQLIDDTVNDFLPFVSCDIRVSQQGSIVTFQDMCDPEVTYQGIVDSNGVVTGEETISDSVPGCSITAVVGFSYDMSRTTTEGGYAISWDFSAGCGLHDCTQTLKSRLRRVGSLSIAGDSPVLRRWPDHGLAFVGVVHRAMRN